MEKEEDQVKWQPVMMVVNRRLECECGALAIFVTGKLSDAEIHAAYNVLTNVDVWCQECFRSAQQKE